MNKDTLELVTPFVRHVLTLLGTTLASRGLITGSDSETIAGSATLLVNLVWIVIRVYGKKKAQKNKPQVVEKPNL